MGREQVDAFAAQLRELRERAGNPSFRAMAARSGVISHTTLHEAASGTRFPSWETTREFVRACGGAEEHWRAVWDEVQRASEAEKVLGLPAPAGDSIKATTPTTSAGSPASEVPEPGHTAQTSEDLLGERTLWRRLRRPLVTVGVILLLLVVVAAGYVAGRDEPPAAVPSPTAASSAGALFPGDASKFVRDVTIPDGSHVRVNERFTKVWEIQNTGTVAWHRRYLEPQNPPETGHACSVPHRVLIGDTVPGDRVMISVPVAAPAVPGTCWVSWKMVDDQGRQLFPSSRPVYFLVTVVA
jgi:hypothetical protein